MIATRGVNWSDYLYFVKWLPCTCGVWSNLAKSKAVSLRNCKKYGGARHIIRAYVSGLWFRESPQKIWPKNLVLMTYQAIWVSRSDLPLNPSRWNLQLELWPLRYQAIFRWILEIWNWWRNFHPWNHGAPGRHGDEVQATIILGWWSRNNPNPYQSISSILVSNPH